ncbi:putative heavy metal-associated domain, HMA, heavy metal-associated domain superfamily [Helianthus debilis subsp. tardiflorus]
MASTEPPQPVTHKTCVLRVSIHCEGCKRKVNKILQSVPGVHDIVIERQNQRVVVTGDVSPESLLRKLVKSGKHAELWPENPQNHSRRTEKVSGNEEAVVSGKEIKQPVTKTETPAVEIAVSDKEIKPPATKTEVPVVASSRSSDPVVQSGVAPVDNNGRKVEEFGGKVTGEKKVEEKKPESGSASDSAGAPVVEKQTGDDGAAVGGGEEKKKKKKKKEKEGQNSNLNSIGEASSSAPPQQTKIRSSNQSPPRQHGYRYPEPYHHGPPPAPVYTVSYNTAHPPVNSYTASYYAAAPPQSYAYSHYGSATAPPPPMSVPSDYYESYAQQGDSFEMFSDENPNGCYVM